MRSKRKQIISVLFALLNVLLFALAAPNGIEEVSRSNQNTRSNGSRILSRITRELNRVSSTYKSSNAANGVSCTTECRLVAGYSARSQAELDALARDMTNQIVYDLRSGKLQRSQINTPNWFEHHVADRLTELEQQHRSEFQRNLNTASNQYSIQHQQQQQQINQYQQQSQSQQNIGYIQPISTGNTYQRIVEEHHKEINHNSVYPTPVTVYHGATILQRNNCSDQINHVSYPQMNIHNQYNQHVESNRQIHTQPSFVVPIGGGESRHVSETIEHTEHRTPQVPIVIPSQSTYTRQYEEQQRQIHRQQPRPRIYGINQRNRTSHVETKRVHNVQIVTPAPTPIVTRQDVYNHFYESENVPDYKPVVTIGENTKFHELEVHNRHRDYQPVVIPTVTQSTHIEKEEEQIDRQYQQRPIQIKPQITTSVTNEEVEVSHQVTQRPYIHPTERTIIRTEENEDIQRVQHQRPQVYPTEHTITRTEENEDIQRVQHQRPQFYPTEHTVTRTEENEDIQRVQHQPKYPTFSHTTNVHSYNESHNTQENSQTIYHQPNGGKITTIKETHYVTILPQPANQHVYEYTEQEYVERLNRIQQELRRLGYGTLTEEEYNSTISSGGFIHNGYKYLYNADHGRYEKTEKVEVNEEEYHSLLRGLQNQLHEIGVQMTEREYNQTIEDGYFVQNGVRYVFDSETGHYYRQDITDTQYDVLRQRIQNESNRHGWSLTTTEINQAIATGVLVINGHRYTLDKEAGVLVEGQDVQISEQEYRTILRRLQEQLQHLGFEQMTEREYNQTINSGYFVRNGQKYRYNADIGRYEQVEITDEEYHVIVTKLKETLQRLNYRQMSEKEMNATIATGKFIRGGYEWTYNTETGETNAIRITSPFEELTETEYESIYRRLQALIKSSGYPQMSEIECRTAITSGTFSRGGNQWVYQPADGEFERIELSETEYNFRLTRLIEVLTKLGIEKTESEQRDIIHRGNFYHGGHRYEYDATSQTFVQIHMTAEEYEERKRQLLEQLQQIGYGTMTDSECRATINSGVFYYGGHEWVYSYQSNKYEMGQASDKENGIVDDNYFNNIGFDNTQYGTSKTEEEKPIAFDIDKVDKNKRPKEIISKTRGDQPPQTFEEDYDVSEEVTERAQKIVVPTQATERPRPIVTTPGPYVVTTISNDYNQRIESQRITQYVVPPPETDYEQRYHHKKTTYTHRTGYVPVNQEVLSRSRKSGSTGFELESDDAQTIDKPIELNDDKQQVADKTPMTLHNEDVPTKTRFSGRRHESNTASKATNESTADFWNRLKAMKSQ